MLLSQSNHFPSKQSRKVRNLRSERNWHHPIRISASTFDKSRRLNRADCSCHRACTVRSTNFALPLLISPMINYALSRPPICNNSDLHGFQLNEAPIEYSLFFHELMHTRASIGLRLLNRIINFKSTRVRTSFCFGKQL